MTHGSLFSGIGGFDLAAEWMGWENKFHCENNTFCQQVLNYYWPNAKSYGDIKETNFAIWRGLIDVVSGGFPCQPYSLAGKRKGNQDDRHLWPFMLTAIKSIQPRWVVGENVLGLINWSKGLVFHEVQTDLEAAGYEVWPYVLPACSLNAPHRRDRVWFVAHSERQRRYGYGHEVNADKRNNAFNDIGQNDASKIASDTEGDGIHRTQEHEDDYRQGGEWRRRNADDPRKIQKRGITADTGNQGLQGRQLNGTYDPERQIRGEQPSGSTGQFCEITDWQQFPTQSPVCSRNDGLPSELAGITFSKHRNESIKGYGNAIVPQVANEIFKTIEQYENLNHSI